MRVQIYQEEMDTSVEVIETTSRNGEHFYGLRIWLKTCQELLDHSTPEDDDRSAITFWADDEQKLRDFADRVCLSLGGIFKRP